MKNKGFTLVELLAVIVVLALILLIAVPKILRVIEESEKEAFRLTGEHLVKGARDKYLMDSIVSISSKTYTIEDGVFVEDSIPMNGKLPDNGTIKVREDGSILLLGKNDKYCLRKDYNDNKVTIDTDIESCKMIGAPPLSCFTYTKTSIEVTMTGYKNISECPKDVVIPDTIDGLPVKIIGEYAFSTNQLTSVTIPNSVISIGNNAFSTNQLTSVTIPNGVTNVGFYAFDNNKLTSIVIPNSVTTMGDYAFSRNQLTSITIPNRVTRIGWCAFYDNQLTNITIPDSVIYIGEYAFSRNQLTSITIPNSVTTIKAAAFNDNQLPDSQAFIYKRNNDGSEDKTTIISYGGGKRDNLIIPNSVTSIATKAFCNNQLTNVTIPDSVTSIATKAFFYNNQLTNVTIPDSVTIINDSVSQSFYDSYVTQNSSQGGTYTAPSQTGTWTKQ